MQETVSTPIPAAETRATPQRFRWLFRLTLAGIGLLAAVVALHFWLDYRSRRLWDSYVAARRAAGEPVLVEDLVETPERGNASLLLDTLGPRVTALVDDGPVAISDFNTNRAAIHAFQPLALDKWAAARTLRDELECLNDFSLADWKSFRTSPLILSLMPMLDHLRSIARLCAFSAVIEHDRGDDAQAIEDVLLGLHIANISRRAQSYFLGNRFTAASDGLQCLAIEELQVGLLIDEAGEGGAVARPRVRALIARLFDETEVRTCFRRALHLERMMQLDAFLCMADGRMALGWPWRRLPPLFRVMLPTWRTGMLAAARRVDQVVRAGRAPSLPEAQAGMPEARDGAHGAPTRIARLLNGMLESDMYGVAIHYRLLATRRMAATALAIRLFESDCGQPPESLAQLVPDYLPAVPLDPFDGDGRAIGYTWSEDLPRLYSVGEDGIDDGGRIDWTSGYAESPGYDEPLFFLTDRPRPPPNELYSNLLKLDQADAAGEDAAPDAAQTTRPAEDQAPEGDRNAEQHR